MNKADQTSTAGSMQRRARLRAASITSLDSTTSSRASAGSRGNIRATFFRSNYRPCSWASRTSLFVESKGATRISKKTSSVSGRVRKGFFAKVEIDTYHFNLLDEVDDLLDALAAVGRFAENLHDAVRAARTAHRVDGDPRSGRLFRTEQSAVFVSHIFERTEPSEPRRPTGAHRTGRAAV